MASPSNCDDCTDCAYRAAAKTGSTMLGLKRYSDRFHRKLWWLPVLLALGLLTGCYNGDALLKQAQSKSLNTTLAEVDLGQFKTTLPRDPSNNVFASLELHIFGTVPRSKLADVEKQLKSEEYRVRHETLVAIRQTSRDELTDPMLGKLRARIEHVVNQVLADAPVKDVGFYQLTLR